MEKVDFEKAYNEIRKRQIERTDSWIHDTIKTAHQFRESQKYKSDEFYGKRCIPVTIEEMSELTKELTKFLRDKGDMMNMLQEIADVYICLDTLRDIFDISDEELKAAEMVKYERLLDGMDKNPEVTK